MQDKTIDVIKSLTRAIIDGDVIKVAYFGGSQPGAVRRIKPLAWDRSNTSVLKAFCLETGEMRFFNVHRIALKNMDVDVTYDLQAIEKYLANPKSPEPQYDLAAGKLRAALDTWRAKIEGMGWHIEAGDCHVSLFRTMKNGSRRKQSDLDIYYRENTTQPEYETIIRSDSIEPETRLCTIPYTYRRWQVTGGLSYGHEDFKEAFDLFLKEAENKATEFELSIKL